MLYKEEWQIYLEVAEKLLKQAKSDIEYYETIIDALKDKIKSAKPAPKAKPKGVG